MRFIFHKLELSLFLIMIILVAYGEGKRRIKEHPASSRDEIENKSTFITVRIPAHIATHKKDCFYEGKVHRHGHAWSPGPCIPECRCQHGHVKCSKIECPDLNCETSIKKKWKCCPECLPEMENGTSCGIWTKGGNGNGGCCMFPFNYHGVLYYTCTFQDHHDAWCAVSSDFDKDGVWGECIDKGDSIKALRFNHDHGKGMKTANHIHDEATDIITNEAVQNAAQEIAQEHNPGENVTAPISNVTDNTSQPASATPTVPLSNATASSSAGIQPSTTSSQGITAPASSAVPSNVSSAVSQPSLAPTQPAASVLPPTGESSIPAPSSSAVVPLPTPSASAVASVPSPSPSAAVPLPTPSPSAVVPLPSPSPSAVVPVPAPSPSAVVPVPAPSPSAVVPVPAPSSSAVVPVQSSIPSPSPSAAIPVVPQASTMVSPTSQPVVVPGQPTLPGQPGVVVVPGGTYPSGGTPPLGPQPVPQPTQGAQPSQPISQPFPATQTTLNPGQTEIPTQAGAAGQVVHEVTTTEYNPNHNVTTTETWLGKPNETLNRTNEVENLPPDATAVGYRSDNMPNNGLSNQTSYGYQAASSPYTYQSQNQGAYADQRSDSREGYASYDTAQNNGYYNNDAYGQYGASQGENTAEQENYYSNQQQYQNTADQGSYYTG